MAHLAFILHGKVPRLHRLWASIEAVFRPEHQIEALRTDRPGQSRSLARQALGRGYTHLISVGGDGSLNEVANGIMDGPPAPPGPARHAIRLGVLPRGTGNDFVKTVPVPRQLEALKATVERDAFRAIDLGQATFRDRGGRERRRYFLNITDVGLGGKVMEQAAGYGSGWGKRINYQRAILRTLLTYRNQTVHAQADSFAYQGSVKSLVVAKGKYFGSGLGIAPDAEPDDGRFAVVILGDVSLWDYLSHLGPIRAGRKLDHPKVAYHRARQVRITAPHDPLPIDLDGEFVGYTPLEIELVPRAIRFLTRPDFFYLE